MLLLFLLYLYFCSLQLRNAQALLFTLQAPRSTLQWNLWVGTCGQTANTGNKTDLKIYCYNILIVLTPTVLNGLQIKSGGYPIGSYISALWSNLINPYAHASAHTDQNKNEKGA